MIEFDEDKWQINLPGNNQPQNYIIPTILLVGGLKAYNSIGFCPLFSLNIFPNLTNQDQSLINGFGAQSFSLLGYGSAALVLAGFLFFSAFCNIGAGSIRFEKTNEQITLAFKGYPGKNERLFFSYSFRELQCIKILYTQTPVRTQSLFLVLEGSREIPIWSSQDPSKFLISESFVTNLGLEMGFTTEIVDRAKQN
uniref:photosystem I assembly protein ycf4 n=1 Tax=Neustupella aerophytica TaxID=2962111 RepID=UPI002181F61F|nr:photosystem I assembly protein ycf4 [Neustupella aerophytica]UVI61173.1 photosystem I assembly protein ycf4 [Neustupella aerophytica]